MDVGHETTFIPGAEGVVHPEGSSEVSASGRGDSAPGGVFGHGTRERRRPGNLGDPHSSLVEPGIAEKPDPKSPTRRRFVGTPAADQERVPTPR